jgi:hypothetical protein
MRSKARTSEVGAAGSFSKTSGLTSTLGLVHLKEAATWTTAGDDSNTAGNEDSVTNAALLLDWASTETLMGLDSKVAGPSTDVKGLT